MIDAHHHFWEIARGDYGWLTPELRPLYRDFGPADLASVLARHGLSRTILVQAAPTVAETEYLLALADAASFVAGVVGWVDFTSRTAPDTIARLAGNALLVGLRPMVQDIADDDWLLRADLKPAVQAMIDHGLTFDALILPRHLPRLLRFVERYPGLPVAIDHGAKPAIRDRAIESWRSNLAVLARHPKIRCKLSGLVTEAAPGWSKEDMRPYCGILLDLFGPDRLMWGSDWPVVELAGGYDAWRTLSLEVLSPLNARGREAVLGGNAAAFYLASRGRSV
ncbi:MAG: amidohydrolase family protein [Hyphomicrobiaceae bacterium]